MSSSVHIKNLFTSVFNAESILGHIDGQTETVISIDAIINSDGSVAAGGPLHSARLRARPRWVRTPVFSVCDPEVRVIGLGLDTLDSFDRVRDVGVVDERTIPDEETVSMQLQERKTNKVLLFFQEVDEFDIAILAKVPFQPLLAESIEVLDVSDVHVPRRTRVDGERESGRE